VLLNYDFLHVHKFLWDVQNPKHEAARRPREIFKVFQSTCCKHLISGMCGSSSSTIRVELYSGLYSFFWPGSPRFYMVLLESGCPFCLKKLRQQITTTRLVDLHLSLLNLTKPFVQGFFSPYVSHSAEAPRWFSQPTLSTVRVWQRMMLNLPIREKTEEDPTSPPDSDSGWFRGSHNVDRQRAKKLRMNLRKSSGNIFETASNRKRSRENWRGKGARSLSLSLSHQRRPIATVFQLSVTVLQSC